MLGFYRLKMARENVIASRTRPLSESGGGDDDDGGGGSGNDDDDSDT